MADNPRQISGREIGAAWEEVFTGQARANGLIPLRNHLTARMIGGPGSVKVVKSELDFCLIRPARRDPEKPYAVAWVDSKTFDADYLDYSRLLGGTKKDSAHQIERAAMYQSFGIPAGFVVWHRPSGLIVFYSGSQVEKAGPRTRFLPSDGLTLGKYHSFDLRPILAL
jgi:hypothetical protein